MDNVYAGMTFEQVLRKYADDVTRVCVIHCGNQTDAEDCFQNVFFKLYRSNMTFESEAHIRAWLIRVAINECIDWHRQVWKKRITLSDQIGIYTEQSSVEREDSILPYLGKLPFKYRSVLYCYYYEDMKVEEISAQLSIPQNTVKTHLSRGRKMLEKVLLIDQEEDQSVQA